MTDNEFEQVIAHIEAARTLGDLCDVIHTLRERFGLAHVAYHAMVLPDGNLLDPIVLQTYDRKWVDRYIAKNYHRIDPVLQEVWKGFLPIDWSMIDRTSTSVQHFFGEAETYGVGSRGLTFPIRGPGGERAVLTVTTNLPEPEWHSRRLSYMRDFQLLAQFFHDRAINLAGGRPKRCLLSAREAESLRLAAAGRHIKQIADELQISVSAIQLYLRNARRKLGCASLTEAAVKAGRLDLLIDHRCS
ncbi:helix-turn-helix transcriptional regulator [Methylobacterium aquaticum]|uniref:helix-turn-helix transcriptional regulator n=1 Tax=Methylobacterium aquaticum TaxID=270351 RepID=UPI00193252B5|nr:LuxR family transcriptional regulator [Methylobacterium aquaticum]